MSNEIREKSYHLRKLCNSLAQICNSEDCVTWFDQRIVEVLRPIVEAISNDDMKIGEFEYFAENNIKNKTMARKCIDFVHYVNVYLKF